MIDRTIPYIPIMMVKRDMDIFPDCALHPDYEFAFFAPETGKEDWVRVQFLSGQIEDEKIIGDLFDREFMTDPGLLPNQMLFVRERQRADLNNGGGEGRGKNQGDIHLHILL